jgi:hypothetical protein
MVMRRGEKDTAVVFAQVPLLRSQLEALKRRSGTITTKDALTVAVNHYLRCPALDDATAGATASDTGARAERDDGGEGGQEEEDWWWAPSPPVKGKG